MMLSLVKSRAIVLCLGLLCLAAGTMLVIVFFVSGNGHFGYEVAPTRTPKKCTPTASPSSVLLSSSTPKPTQVTDSLVPTRTPTSAPFITETCTPSSHSVSTLTPTRFEPTLVLESSKEALMTTPHSSTPKPVLETAAPISTPTETSLWQVPPDERFRLGVSLPNGAVRDYGLSKLHIGWVMDWSVRAQPVVPPSVDYAQTVRMRQGSLRPGVETLTAVASARPGSIWLISNEPDVRWQDNVVPEVYARLYRDAYAAIKLGDPSATVVAGGIAQVTPLRLKYLDLVLQSYRAQFGESLPTQAWQIHTYMLREERGSWGVDIPPGLTESTGKLYTIEDSGNLALFREQIYSFREWMASRGYQGLPLFVTEFGILMPSDYGFPTERVSNFLEETWRFFLTASDPALGDPSDGGRLVQRWCWFSLGTIEYPNSSLIDPNTGEWTPFTSSWLILVGE